MEFCPLQLHAFLSLQVDLKTPNRPPAYAFVEFDDPRDARDAVHGRDGYVFAGGAIRVSHHPSCVFVKDHFTQILYADDQPGL